MPIGQSFPKSIVDKPKKPHMIEDISYSKDFILCVCSWRGPVDDYLTHRKEGNAAIRKAAQENAAA